MLIVDNSRLSAVAQCSTQAVMRYVLNLTKKGENIAAYCGKSVHEALLIHFAAEYALKDKDELTHKLVGDTTQIALQRFDEMYENFSREQLPEDRLTHSNVREVLEQYLRKHPVEKYANLFTPIGEHAEKGLLLPLDEGEDIWFFALIDLPVRDVATGAINPLDHKTTGRITQWWTKKFGLSSQLDGYVWACREFFQTSSDRAYVNAIELSKLPDARKTRCRVHGMPYEDCRLMHANAELLMSTRSEESVQEWKKVAIGLAKKFRELQKFSTIEMMPFVRQQGKFNNSCTFCEFSDFCRGDRSPRLIEGNYIEEAWEPWRGRVDVGQA